MKSMVKRGVLGLSGLVALAAVSLGTFVEVEASEYDASVEQVYDIPVPDVARSIDPKVVARGKHIVDAVAGCSSRACHGADLAGGERIDLGPVGSIHAPNLSVLAVAYADGELARLVRHGIKKDGRTVRFMPVQDFNWLSDADLIAIVSYLRTVPPVDRENDSTNVKTLGKVLDRRGQVRLDVAGHMDHTRIDQAPPPSPTPEYGRFLARACTGCHGEHLSGGPIPGAPSSVPVPLNLTPDDTGLAGWTFEDFDRLLSTGARRSGKRLDPFMPTESFGKLEDDEKRALWAYLRTLPPTKLGQR
jgi:cytochrome c553